MGTERDSGREPRSDPVRVVYAFTYRGRENGCNVEMQKELMYSLRDPSGGGGSQPYILCVGVDFYNQTTTGGVSKTLNNRATDADHVPCVICYGISAYESNAMKSSNPHSGIYIAETSRTLDFNGGNPACNQGGGACAVHQNGNGEVQMSEVGYTVSTNSNASGRNTPIVLVYESHNQDSRYRPLGDICETVSAKYGTGGGATHR